LIPASFLPRSITSDIEVRSEQALRVVVVEAKRVRERGEIRAVDD
jgi:hypothetical protein